MENRFKRVTTYVSVDKYRTFRSILVLQGLTISEWFRRGMDEEIEKANQDPHQKKNVRPMR